MWEVLVQIFSIFGLCLLASSMQFDFSYCNSQSNGYYEYIADCSTYVSCQESNTELKYCPKQTLFNGALRICDTPEAVDCLQKYSRDDSEPNPCQGQTSGSSYPYIDCSQYILCLGNDQSVIAKCPTSSWYDPSTGSCGPDISPTACLDALMPSTTARTPPDPDDLCAEQESGIPFPLVTDCSKYIMCLGSGKWAIVNCIYNAWYDPITGNCGQDVSPTACEDAYTPTTTTLETTPSTTTTTTTTEPPLSPDICGELRKGEYVSYPDNCSKYIVCIDPIPIAFYCTPGYYFNEKLQQCVDWQQSDCPKDSTPGYGTTPGYTEPSICANGMGSTLPYPDNCQWYMECVSDNVYMMGVCYPSEYYDPAIGKCSSTASPDACREDHATTQTTIITTEKISTTTVVPTTTKATTASPHPCDDVEEGKLVPYPYDCAKFIKCVSPTPIVYPCAEGQEFSAALQRCMAPWVANCPWH